MTRKRARDPSLPPGYELLPNGNIRGPAIDWKCEHGATLSTCAKCRPITLEDARAERARIVAWLRRGGAAPLFDTYEHATFEILADAIAKGRHRK